MSKPHAHHTFGATTTATEVIDGVDLHGRRAVVTGASSGIGVETARALAAAGADVTLAVRNTDAGNHVAARLEAELPPNSGQLTVGRLDLADRSTVETFVADWTGPLHILVNNAGVMALPQLTRTPDGREMQFSVNHLGHFALAVGLRPALAAADGARIVSVASIGHLFSPVVFDDLDYRFRPYDPWTSYGQSKTANVLFAVGAAERWADDGVAAHALMPGNIADTSLARHLDLEQLAGFMDTTGLALPPGKPSSKVLRLRFCWRPHRSLRASPATTSRTAHRPRRSPNEPVPSPVWHRTPWTGTTLPGCGPYPKPSSARASWSAGKRILTRAGPTRG
ncbi:SDR family NAD(P)-dependent oxidoreductase [Streptomyces sp. NPDC005479]|uniref:SDR family NAD(P)-dependent oxidoreductase n=1 Tax=unclassified Streptomyces TaxID=2593676 RepID=UPI0033AE7D62